MNRTTNKWMIAPDDAVMLFIDSQSGLFQLVRDIDETTLRAHVTALAKVSFLTKIPTFTTDSRPDGPSGRLIPEIHKYNPDAISIPRSGQVNAWDNPAWVKAIEATKRRTLLIAGSFMSVGLAQPALSAISAGYRAFAIVDASGDSSKMSSEITTARLTQAGVIPIDTYAVHSELMGSWNRPDATEFAAITSEYILPAYQTLIENFEQSNIRTNDTEADLDGSEPDSPLWEASLALQKGKDHEDSSSH